MDGKSLRRLARTALPRPVVGALRDGGAFVRRRALERRLPNAPRRFEEEYAAYWATGVVPPDAEELVHLATWNSGGILPREAARAAGRPFDPAGYAAFPDALLAGLDPAAVAAGLERDGCWVAPDRLPGAAVDELLAVLDAGPARPRGDGLGGLPAGPPGPGAPTWWMDPVHAVGSASVRRLLAERRLAEVGGTYLGVDPMIMSIVLWKSFAWPVADGNSAQQFHFDNDRAAFVKMFVYLTDVGPDNGPHTFVSGSHRAKPKALLHGGRLSDDEVAGAYPPEGWAVITGARGTVFFADTQGFHKGGQVTAGERAMFQVNLASDRFGVHEPAIGPPAAAPAELACLVAGSPRYFAQLWSEGALAP